MPNKKIKRKAVIVGINKYQDKKIAPLAGAKNDATDIFELLNEWGTFEISDEQFLVNERATCQAIRSAINDLLIQTDPNELSLFYFSGHGKRDGYGNGYLAPYDMISDKPFVNGVNMGELRKVILDSHQKSILTILDCCYSGIAAKGKKGTGDVRDPWESNFCDVKKESGEGKYIMASSEKDIESRERSDFKLQHEAEPHAHGIFTFHILEGLYGYGTSSDETGKITLQSLQNYIKSGLGKDKQKPKFWMDYADPLDEIIIGFASDKRQNFLDLRLNKAEDLLFEKGTKKVKKDLDFIIEACKITHELFEIAGKNKDVIRLRKVLIESIAEWKEDLIGWVGMNATYMKTEYQQGDLLNEIDIIIDKLDFDGIKDIMGVECYRALINCLSNAVTKKDWDLKKFVERSKPIYSKLTKTLFPVRQVQAK